MPSVRPRGLVAACTGLPLLLACASTRPPGAGALLEPRFVAVHNALVAMGLAQIGPIQTGTVAQGGEVRVAVELPGGCPTLVALGGDGIRDLDATLLDAAGAPVAHDTTAEPQAVLRPCLDAAGTYTLLVKAASGGGSWIVAAWSGGAGGAAASSAAGGSPPAEARGTCESPIPLSPGVFTGTTAHGERENAGSCGPSESRELVYELDVRERQRVVVDVEARFDSVLYIRKDDCADPDAEVACNDDAQDRAHSRVESVLDPGKYFVFVDGYGHDAGAFKMTVTASDVLALADVCRRAPVLVAGATQTATTEGLADDAQATCGGGAGGADAAWRTELAARSRVRLVEHSDDMTPVVHVRRACVDELSEVACGDSGAASGDATVTGVLDAGSYTVFADGHEHESSGHYALTLETAPVAGSGTSGDGCGDAMPIGAASSGSLAGDTFAARDDVAGTCGGAGAPDVVYRLDVPRRSRLVASFDDEEAPHVAIVWRRCADRGSEVACGRAVDEILAPGTYFVAVDGTSPEAFGRFTLRWWLRDLSGQASACAAAPTLVDGRTVNASTGGGADRFVTSCGGTDAGASGADRVFKLVLSARAAVRLVATAPTFDPALSLRKACPDTSGGGGIAELACDSAVDGNHRVTVERPLEAGTYWVVVDGQTPADQGPFTLEYRVVR